MTLDPVPVAGEYTLPEMGEKAGEHMRPVDVEPWRQGVQRPGVILLEIGLDENWLCREIQQQFTISNNQHVLWKV